MKRPIGMDRRGRKRKEKKGKGEDKKGDGI